MSGGHRRAVLVDLTVAPIVAITVAVVLVLGAEALRIPAGSNVGLALTATGGALIAGLLVYAARGSRQLGVPLAWLALAALSAGPLALFLANTPHYLNGISGDQQFRVEFLTRFADSVRPADFAYPDMPPYYPAGWFWVGGRLASFLGVEAWAFHKVFAVATVSVTSVLAFALWSMVTSRRKALGAAVATTLAGLATLAPYTPYSWLTGALVPPMAVLGLRLLRRRQEGQGGAWMHTAVLLGLILGVAAVTHTQILVFAGFVLVTLTAQEVVTRRKPVGGLPGSIGIMVLAMLPLTLLHWLPYLLESAGRPVYNAGQHFLADAGSRWPLPMLEPSGLGALCLAGTVWIVVRFRSHEVARALGTTAACGYAWYALSTAVLSLGTTLLAFRIQPVLTAALASGAVWAATDVVRLLRPDRDDYMRSRATPATTTRATAVTSVLTVLAAVVVVAQVQNVPPTYSWAYGPTRDYRPDGTRPDGSSDPRDSDAHVGALRATIDGLTGRPAAEVVIATANRTLPVYAPYFTFQAAAPQYANPLAEFPSRTDELRRWTTATDPEQLLQALDRSPVRGPSVFVLERAPDGMLHLPTVEDRFPVPQQGAPPAVFAPQLFDDPAWQRRDVGPYAVLVRAGVPPVP